MMNKFWTAIFVMFVIASLLIDNRSVRHCISFNSLELTECGLLMVYCNTNMADSKNK